MYEERILLASASPRRRELIHQIDPEARFLSGDVDEYLPEGISPEKAVVMLAEKKALCSASLLKSAERKGTIVIGCDTLVALDGVIYGKPEDEADAARLELAHDARYMDCRSAVIEFLYAKQQHPLAA